MASKQFSPEQRTLLVNTLTEQYHAFGIDLTKNKKVQASIKALANSDTYTVTTGHQLCLLTGPAYFIYKIISTIQLAEQLKEQYPEKNFVPVYWMASEDHDFAEINHLYIHNRKFTWDKDSGQKPVGRLSLDGLAPVLDEVDAFYSDPVLKAGVQKLTAHYRNSSTLAEATLRMVNDLFASYGVVVIEPDHAAFKRSFIPAIINDITAQSNYPLLQQTNQLLKEHKYKAQVNGREINFFYITPGNEERRLLRFQKGMYEVVDTEIRFTKEALLAEIQEHPERFSPNVVMRPLYQETILPNLAYIGGPGEIAYWLQLKPVFDHNHIAFPVLQLRNFVLQIEKGIENRLALIGIEFKDLFLPGDELAKLVTSKQEEVTQFDIVADIEKLLQELVDVGARFDSSLAHDAITFKLKLHKETAQWAKDLHTKQIRRSEKMIAKANELKSLFFPEGELQERKWNVLSFLHTTADDIIGRVHNSPCITDAINIIYQ